VIIQVSGDASDTSVVFADPIVNIVDNQIAITIDMTHSGIGLPVVLPYSVDVPIGMLSSGEYSFHVTLREIIGFPTYPDSASGSFSVTAQVPGLSVFSLAVCCLLMAGLAAVACRHLTHRALRDS
jgi:hypothetical protein